ncbi:MULTISPECIES: hypothetical protein [unclassified Rathayibacter]|uniref:hypothetical protein n=1 Tax=unclassified Rathayibacter TaxID=2609250 RepID=UPI0006F417B0|nr:MULTISPECIES: hypothetical protein [unclassified Rathayibacter]KQQ01568.1 hypothetical protein ASF42_14065 [Rathayibacter sp. Leaf294]KQS11600.1 hypothetical protein ASG06_14065 [Rathayibacter sp. Leaf185]
MAAIRILTAEPSVPVDLLLPVERDEQLIRAGRWSLRLSDGRLDDLRYGTALILRGIRFVVRDRDWGTLPTTRTTAVAAAGGLLIEGESSDGAARVHWTLRVGVEDSVLSVALEAVAASSFLRNRLGLVVLHAPSVAGTPFEARHPDGSVESLSFPERIAPHQPARDLAGLSFTVSDVPVELSFEGDVFEMEDQRNWTDGSFKTYSTPLDLPFPVRITAGDTVHQSIRVTCGAAPRPAEQREPAPESAAVVAVSIGGAAHPLPEIRTAASSAPSSDRSRHRSLLGLLVEVDPRWAGWRAALERAVHDAPGAVDLRIVAAAADDVDAVLDALGDTPLARVGVFAAEGHRSESELLERARRAARERDAQAIGGVRSHFTELNRGAEALAPLDAPLAFSITPFMHDRSGHQLVESLAQQRAVVQEARRIAAGRRLHVGPVTLGARMNAVSTSPFDPGDEDIERSGYGPQNVPGATDERQSSPSLAAWVVGSLDALAQEGVDSLAYFEQWGPRGVAGRDGLAPAGRVLEWAAELSGALRREVHAPGLAALAAGTVVLLGNLGGEAVEVAIDGVVEWRRAGGGGSEEGAIRLAPGDAVRIELAAQPSSV